MASGIHACALCIGAAHGALGLGAGARGRAQLGRQCSRQSSVWHEQSGECDAHGCPGTVGGHTQSRETSSSCPPSPHRRSYCHALRAHAKGTRDWRAGRVGYVQGARSSQRATSRMARMQAAAHRGFLLPHAECRRPRIDRSVPPPFFTSKSSPICSVTNLFKSKANQLCSASLPRGQMPSIS